MQLVSRVERLISDKLNDVENGAWKGKCWRFVIYKKKTTQGQTHVWNVYCLCLTFPLHRINSANPRNIPLLKPFSETICIIYVLFWYLYIFIAKIEIECLGSVQKIVYSYSIKPAQTWRQLGYMQCNYMLSFNNYNYNHTMGEYTLH